MSKISLSHFRIFKNLPNILISANRLRKKENKWSEEINRSELRIDVGNVDNFPLNFFFLIWQQKWSLLINFAHSPLFWFRYLAFFIERLQNGGERTGEDLDLYSKSYALLFMIDESWSLGFGGASSSAYDMTLIVIGKCGDSRWRKKKEEGMRERRKGCKCEKGKPLMNIYSCRKPERKVSIEGTD